MTQTATRYGERSATLGAISGGVDPKGFPLQAPAQLHDRLAFLKLGYSGSRVALPGTGPHLPMHRVGLRFFFFFCFLFILERTN
jgi:hypothetical protein